MHAPSASFVEHRARTLGYQPGLVVAAGVEIGRGCRLILEPGSRIVIGDQVEIDDGTTLAVYDGGILELRPNCFVGHHCTLAARSTVTIGERTHLAELVSIRDHDHDPDSPPHAGITQVDPVRIGSDVWIAAKATITRGIEIGDNTVVGANAVVTRSLAANVVAGGIPARVIREKLTDTR